MHANQYSSHALCISGIDTCFHRANPSPSLNMLANVLPTKRKRRISLLRSLEMSGKTNLALSRSPSSLAICHVHKDELDKKYPRWNLGVGRPYEDMGYNDDIDALKLVQELNICSIDYDAVVKGAMMTNSVRAFLWALPSICDTSLITRDTRHPLYRLYSSATGDYKSSTSSS